MYIKKIIIYFFVLIISTNTYANISNDEISIFVESVSLNEDHTIYYGIADMNSPKLIERNLLAQKTINIKGLEYPYFYSILHYLEKELKSSGYIKLNKEILDKVSFNEHSFFPIVIKVCYFYGENSKTFNSTLSIDIVAQSYIVPSQKQSQITGGEYYAWVDANPSKTVTTSPLWNTTLSFSKDNPMQKEINLISMIKCAQPYFNKNFKGTITCKR